MQAVDAVGELVTQTLFAFRRLRALIAAAAETVSTATEKSASVFPAAYEFNLFMGTLKPLSSGPIYSNTVIGTLAVDGWAVTICGTARRARPVPSSLYEM